jgi:serine/threonine protein kinase
MSSTASLGQGAYGYVVKRNSTSGPYVKKRMYQRFHKDPEVIQLFENQKQMLHQLDKIPCPYIVKLHQEEEETKSSNPPHEIALEGLFPPWKELFTLISDSGESISDLYPVLQKILPKLVDAVECLHHHGIVHRDIKPDNIMVNPETMDLRLIDFGFARKDPTPTVKGTPQYMAPDMLVASVNNETFSMDELKQFDLWSLGITIYSSINGFHPISLIHPAITDITQAIVLKNFNHEKLPGINAFHTKEQLDYVKSNHDAFLKEVASEYRDRVDFKKYLIYNPPHALNRRIPPIILGSGVSGIVVKRRGNPDFVQKILHPQHVTSKDDRHRKSFKEEQKILRHLSTINCPYVLRLDPHGLSSPSQESSFRIRLQGLFPPWKELFTLIKNSEPISTFQQTLPKLVDAIECLHHHGIVHRDIKPDNIMVNPETMDLRLIDFGFARTDSTHLRTGTLSYLAPDMLTVPNGTTFSIEELKQFDLWSLGMTLFVTIQGKNPLQNMNIEQITTYYNRPRMPYITWFPDSDKEKLILDKYKDFLKGVAHEDRKRVDYMYYLKYNPSGTFNRHIPSHNQRYGFMNDHSKYTRRASHSRLPTIIQEEDVDFD